MKISDSQICIKWHVDDIMNRVEERGADVSRKEAKEILTLIDDNHDASIGVNWDVVDMWIDSFIETRAKNEANGRL